MNIQNFFNVIQIKITIVVQITQRILNQFQKILIFVFGKYSENDVKTFEKVLSIMTSPNFKYKEFLPQIKEKFIQLLNRTDLPVPPETEKLG